MGSDAVGNGHTRQGRNNRGNASAPMEVTPMEWSLAARHAGTPLERPPPPDGDDAAGNAYARQAGAAVERIVRDGGDAAGIGQARQAGTTAERLRPNGGDAVGNGQARSSRNTLRTHRPRWS